ncbi:unnamed protein product, partial [Phaeothamnion confervicola]
LDRLVGLLHGVAVGNVVQPVPLRPLPAHSFGRSSRHWGKRENASSAHVKKSRQSASSRPRSSVEYPLA